MTGSSLAGLVLRNLIKHIPAEYLPAENQQAFSTMQNCPSHFSDRAGEYTEAADNGEVATSQTTGMSCLNFNADSLPPQTWNRQSVLVCPTTALFISAYCCDVTTFCCAFWGRWRTRPSNLFSISCQLCKLMMTNEKSDGVSEYTVKEYPRHFAAALENCAVITFAAKRFPRVEVKLFGEKWWARAVQEQVESSFLGNYQAFIVLFKWGIRFIPSFILHALWARKTVFSLEVESCGTGRSCVHSR